MIIIDISSGETTDSLQIENEKCSICNEFTCVCEQMKEYWYRQHSVTPSLQEVKN